MSIEITDWLRGLGLEQYAPAFHDNAIDTEILRELTADDLKDLGINLVGHRRKLMAAIAALRPDGVPIASSQPVRPRPDAGIRAGEAERRQLTVMFCDLVGSTELSTRLDPEDLGTVIGAYRRRASAIIACAGGFVARYMGDGVLAYFGYPRADEHDAERAVRAGLALVEAVGLLHTATGAPLQVRVGIATGLVVVGDLTGEGDARERDVVGETPNLAARLQALAAPNTVVIALSTRELTSGLFEYADLGAVEIKGLAMPVTAARVLRESAAESRFEALRVVRTPLVGRDEELALLRRRWQQATTGEGCVVLVSGEPGIGKSRLAQTLVERLSGEPHTRLRWFCSPHHQESALYPTITQLERAAGFRREDTAVQRLDRLEAVLAQATDDLGEAAPLLATLMSIPIGERYPPLSMTPQKQKERTLRALVAQVEGLAARQPVLMLFEDAQWSDPTSVELLDLIVDRVPALPVFLIITFRPEFTAPWIGRPHVTALGLNRLAPRQRAQMIAGIADGKALPQDIADQIIDRTDGVPLFVEELTKAVVESGMLTDAGDRYTAAGPLAPLAIPASLQASLLARLDRPAPVREVAQIGAALGRQFSHELIGAVAPMPQQQLDDALAQLVGAELVYCRGLAPHAEYTFKHALVQDAAYSTLLRSRRRQLHAHIADTLEERFPEIVAAQPALLAQHCAEGGLAEKAADYCLAAGQQAWERSMLAEAETLFRRGLALVSGLADTEPRRERELNLQIALARVLTVSRSWGAPELIDAHSRARQLASTLKRPRALLFALGGHVNEAVFARADLKRGRLIAEEMRELGQATGDVLGEAMACRADGFVCFNLGEFTAGLAYLEKALALYDPAHRSFFSEVMPYDMLVGVRIHSSFLLACLGHFDQAVARHEAALRDARGLSHPPTLALALASTGISGLRVRLEPRSLLQYADELLPLATEQGLGNLRMTALINRGWCLAALGRADEGIPLLAAGLAGWHDLGFILWRPWGLTLLGDACRMAGQRQTAIEHLVEARRLADEREERWFQAETVRLSGEVLLAMDDPAGAEGSYHEAIAIAQQQSAKLWELRAATSLARLWRDQGKRTQARELLVPVYGWFTEGFGTPVLQEAKALLDELA
jgi:class 3 adenylate cyclase/tetratricopeptide (TPR) repeat protein